MTVGLQVKSYDPQFAILRKKSVCNAGLGTMRRPRLWTRCAMLLCLAFTLAGGAFAAGDDPQEILRDARVNEAAQYQRLEGQIRKEATVIPFLLTLNGGEIKYEFSNPDQTYVLQLKENGSRLTEITKKGGQTVKAEPQYDKEIRGTGITCEDLSMSFLYWPVAKIVGEEVLVTQNCWIIRVEPGPGMASQYGSVRLWIQKHSKALVRVVTYGHDGKPQKRFEVRTVQKVEGGYILKQMRIQKMENGKFGPPTYLEIKNPEG